MARPRQKQAVLHLVLPCLNRPGFSGRMGSSCPRKAATQPAISAISREIDRTDAALYDATQVGRGYAQCRRRCVRRTTTPARTSHRRRHQLVVLRQSMTYNRGSNENTNDLLRQFLPKGGDLSQVSQPVHSNIARLMNGRPWQMLNWKTPDEVLSEDTRKLYKNRCT